MVTTIEPITDAVLILILKKGEIKKKMKQITGKQESITKNAMIRQKLPV